MNGPVQGVATKAASAPVQKDPICGAVLLGQFVAEIEIGQLEQTGKIETDGGNQRQQDKDDPRVLQLEGPAHRGSARPQAEQDRAQRCGDQHDTGGIGQRIPPHFGFIAARLG